MPQIELYGIYGTYFRNLNMRVSINQFIKRSLFADGLIGGVRSL